MQWWLFECNTWSIPCQPDTALWKADFCRIFLYDPDDGRLL